MFFKNGKEGAPKIINVDREGFKLPEQSDQLRTKAVELLKNPTTQIEAVELVLGRKIKTEKEKQSLEEVLASLRTEGFSETAICATLEVYKVIEQIQFDSVAKKN